MVQKETCTANHEPLGCYPKNERKNNLTARRNPKRKPSAQKLRQSPPRTTTPNLLLPVTASNLNHPQPIQPPKNQASPTLPKSRRQPRVPAPQALGQRPPSPQPQSQQANPTPTSFRGLRLGWSLSSSVSLTPTVARCPGLGLSLSLSLGVAFTLLLLPAIAVLALAAHFACPAALRGGRRRRRRTGFWRVHWSQGDFGPATATVAVFSVVLALA